MGDELQYRKYQKPLQTNQEFEEKWLKITEDSHNLFCSCGDWQIHFQFALQNKYKSQWRISPEGGIGDGTPVPDTGSSGRIPDTGDVDSDLELAAAVAAVEADTNGLESSCRE